jgi:release factor glutamine methyltransferase
MPNALLQFVTKPIRLGITWYLSKPRDFSYKNISVTVLPNVFHPGFFHSTKMLLRFLLLQDIHKKDLLELGCGSGIISVMAAKKGAIVTASDINTHAVTNVILNAQKNHVEINAIHSDLYEQLPEKRWDWIIINPPYYPSDPANEAEYAWYCGQEYQYFENLFRNLSAHIHADSQVVMILSEVCDLEKIFSIADRYHFFFEKIAEKKVWVDGKNYLYQIKARP